MKTIVLLIVFFGVLFSYLFYVKARKKRQKNNTPSENDIAASPSNTESKDVKPADDGECCGQHAVCERDTLINTRIKAEYYDDEELDQFQCRDENSYDPDEIKLFEDVFYTLKEYDVSGWLKRLQIRGINPPSSIKEEALFIVQERRFSK